MSHVSICPPPESRNSSIVRPPLVLGANPVMVEWSPYRFGMMWSVAWTAPVQAVCPTTEALPLVPTPNFAPVPTVMPLSAIVPLQISDGMVALAFGNVYVLADDAGPETA